MSRPSQDGSNRKGKKRARESFIPHPTTSHDWEKDDEELDLESRLFGTSKLKSKSNGRGKVEVDNELNGMDDDDVGIFLS